MRRAPGHINLDLAPPKKAREAYLGAFAAIKKAEAEFPQSTCPQATADGHNSIACAHIETGDTEAAFKGLNNALEIHLANDSAQRARTEVIYSLAYLRAQKPFLALEKLRTCWKLSGLTQGDVMASDYPKHSGDIVLLSRIKRRQSHIVEAQELVSHSIVMRERCFGKNSPRVADAKSMLSQILCERGEHERAVKTLHEIIDMCEDREEMLPHLARALWFLGGMEPENWDGGLRENHQMRAREEREKISDREWPDEDTDNSFMKLVGWMLW